MRNWTPLGALVLLVLAGCMAPTPPPSPPTATPALGEVLVPEGATLETLAGGAALAFGSKSLPFLGNFTIPEGATMVRLIADPGESATVNLGMANEETGRRRCNNPTVTSFDHAVVGRKTCSYIALIDPPGATWRFAAAGTGKADVRVEFLTAPLDGIAGKLDLTQLSMPIHSLKPTETQFVPSFDGTRLRVEVTLPEGPGPWPTIIESSPYHDDGVRATPASFAYFVHDWAKRGYAVVVADVRGFGDSGGCVEVWGPNEQKDQAFLVEWAAAQAWSDGNVGFYGQSYVGTTPVEAAVLAPEHLKAIVTVAPVIKNYDDWHFGGVPNGENLLSPIGYSVGTDAATGGAMNIVFGVASGQVPGVPDPSSFPEPRGDPRQSADYYSNGLCDPADWARPNDPRAVYDAYYEERDFARLAGNVKAAVLYTHGFEDANVKAQMIPDWFNAIPSPKLGLFGHWLHQHPPRMDQEVLFLGWMDQFVKGKDLGFASVPAVDVVVDAETHRTADAWPTPGAVDAVLFPDFAGEALQGAPADGTQEISLDATGMNVLDLAPASATLETGVLTGRLHVTGNIALHGVGTLTGASNGYVAAYLYDVEGSESSLVTWGWFNLAHDADHKTYTPRSPADTLTFDMQLRPTEHQFLGGHKIVLELRGVAAMDATDVFGGGGATFTFQGGQDGTRLVLPTLDPSAAQPIPLTAQP